MHFLKRLGRPGRPGRLYENQPLLLIRAANRRRKMGNKLRILTDARRRVHVLLSLLYVNFLFVNVVFGFPLASRLVFILHIYICSSRTREKNCHILIGCLKAPSTRIRIFLNPQLFSCGLEIKISSAPENIRVHT